MLRLCRASVLLFGLAPAATARATAPPTPLYVDVPNQAPAETKKVSPEQYRVRLIEQGVLVANCKARASACDPAKAADDLEVGEGTSSFRAGYEWLRVALAEAAKMKDLERASLMEKAFMRLQEDAAEADATSLAVPLAPDARSKADAILNAPEFRVVTEDSWLLRQWQKLLVKIADGLERAAARVPRSSSLVLIVEWGLLSLAASGLLIWAWRSLRQQRLTVTAPSEARHALWQKESDDWAGRAELEAAAGRWRDAVHCLYWAAIVMLEGKRMWRANRARTPREYLPLLEPGSARQNALGGLTRIFERAWYGLRPAERTDFERAQELVDQLKAG